MQQVATAERTDKSALVFILITVAIDALAIGILIPVLPQLIEHLTGTGLAQAAIYGGWLTALFSIVQFFATPILGNLSDKVGRRPVLLVSLFAFGLNYVLMGFAPALQWLFVAQVLAGIFGATHSTASAYIADVSHPDDRARHFGLISAAFGFGLIFGPMIGGVLGEYGARVPFFAAAGLAFLNVAYGVFILPESLPQERRRAFSIRRANPLGAAIHIRKYPVIFSLCGVLLLVQIAGMTLPATWPYFTMLKFDWSSQQVGYSLGLYGILNIIIQGGLIGMVNRRLGPKKTVMCGLACSIVGYVGFAFAGHSTLLLLFILPSAMGFVTGPALIGIMSNRVAGNAQGELQGALASLYSLATVITPLVMTQLFSFFSSGAAPVHFPGAPYLAAAILAGCSLLLGARSLRKF